MWTRRAFFFFERLLHAPETDRGVFRSAERGQSEGPPVPDSRGKLLLRRMARPTETCLDVRSPSRARASSTMARPARE